MPAQARGADLTGVVERSELMALARWVSVAPALGAGLPAEHLAKAHAQLGGCWPS